VTPLITGTVGLDGVKTAFSDLGNPEKHAKIWWILEVAVFTRFSSRVGGL